MTDEKNNLSPASKTTSTPTQGKGCLKTLGIILVTFLVAVGLTYWLMTSYLFPKSFKPVALNDQEGTVLVRKLRQFGIRTDAFMDSADSADNGANKDQKPAVLKPEVYSEADAKHEVAFSERELNALLAKNTDLSSKLAIDLSSDLASAKLLLPLDPDFPILGGKTLKASAGIHLAFENGRPIVILKGLSVWGVPVPNAWLGGLKNVDLIKEFGADQGFWKSFADGIEHINVSEGKLLVKLKE